MLKEFREFIARGNVMDLAVGIVIGAAFTGIVNSFVKDILTPILGIFGNANFSERFLLIKQGTNPPGPYTTLDAATKAGAVTLNYGNFLTALINFLIVAFALFLIVKAANKLRRHLEPILPCDPPKPPEPTKEELLLTEIRDLLKVSREP
ncbi:large conductance mechanosensitive channel protein MscL [bacterium]|nr:MAG: large conductance mechanosensitive channel protein MscL [bacterium]